jgi:hypothetical protein
MSGSIASGAAYARSASLSISSSNGPQGPQADRGATSIGSGSKLGNVQNTTASVRTATVTQAKPEHEAYGWRDALKDLGSVLSGVAKDPLTRMCLGIGLMIAGGLLAATGVGLIAGGALAGGGLLMLGSGFLSADAAARTVQTQAPSPPTGAETGHAQAPKDDATYAARKAAFMRNAGFDPEDVDDGEGVEDVRDVRNVVDADSVAETEPQTLAEQDPVPAADHADFDPLREFEVDYR